MFCTVWQYLLAHGDQYGLSVVGMEPVLSDSNTEQVRFCLKLHTADYIWQ